MLVSLNRVSLDQVERSAPLSLAQERLWLLHRLDPGDAAYNLTRAFRLAGALEAAALERALEPLVGFFVETQLFRARLAPGLTVTALAVPEATAKLDLALDYATDLFDAATAERMAALVDAQGVRAEDPASLRLLAPDDLAEALRLDGEPRADPVTGKQGA